MQSIFAMSLLLSAGVPFVVPIDLRTSQADDYETTLYKADGTVALLIRHTQAVVGDSKITMLGYGDRKALLSERTSTGDLTLFFPADGKAYQAGKGRGKEPQTSLTYFTMVYANSVAPTKKKSNPLGAIAGNILGGAVSNAASGAISNLVLAGLGEASALKQIGAGIQSSKGYAVHAFASELGKAVMTSSVPVEPGGPEVVDSTVKVKDKVLAHTAFMRRREVTDTELIIPPGEPKELNAQEMYKVFAGFFAPGLEGK